jgi:hypothetical protein
MEENQGGMMDQQRQAARDLAIERLECFMEDVTQRPDCRLEAETIIDAIIEAATPILSEHTRTIEAFRAGVEAVERLEKVGEPKKD